MIVEHAILEVKPGQAAAFEATMRKARSLIEVSPGFQGIEVRPSSDQPERYLLRVIWTDVAAHRDGFRTSDRYEEWRHLLHGFYEPMPTVEYFEESIV
ncbi:antibiotic biosynthesis monooxygenase [Sphingomonas piscis]|uniref:Antibiotic biosynthesis monooxygenase n=1 Tax=Sphingomonas piscis TaxID=2714943 RepID=A0A6G7YPM6_9SPHN|nr:antibiotic biosynthesis monooxygenase [Sphingomonas piscis]QIK78698.1 antibiotic biosynthesis monooxygenase [Sphingomonas piscis]